MSPLIITGRRYKKMNRAILVELEKFINNFDEIYDQMDENVEIKVFKNEKSLTLIKPKKKRNKKSLEIK